MRIFRAIALNNLLIITFPKQRPMANQGKLQHLLGIESLTPDSIGLEIGPGFNPVMPKREGHRVHTLDHMNAEDLRQKYAGAPGVDVSRIEEVDFVSDGGPILELIGKRAHYDYIVASHVIEHTVDLLGFLKDCQALLKPEGKLVLAVPDMRFSFDCLRPLTTTGQVIDMHALKPSRHPPGKIFDEIAYNCQRGGAIAWSKDAQGELQFFRPFSDAKWITEGYQAGTMFLDIHAWQFTPSSFRLMARDLSDMQLLELKELSFETSEGNEFYIVLSRAAQGCPVNRMELSRQTLLEHRQIAIETPYIDDDKAT